MIAREMNPVDQIAEAVEAVRMLSHLIFERGADLDQGQPEVGHILTASLLVNQQMDRIELASSRWRQAGRATVPARGSTAN